LHRFAGSCPARRLGSWRVQGRLDRPGRVLHPKDAYGKIISSFQKTSAGNGSSFSQSYGASGDQARAVAAGQNADLVALSLDPDVNMLVGKAWSRRTGTRTRTGHCLDSVVVFVVRDGNPKHIRNWGDLVKPASR
jgi:sulfate transport system substrate-binding protein